MGTVDEEFVELHTYISSHKLVSTSRVDELKKETQSDESRNEVGKRDHTVRQLFLSLCTELDATDLLTDTNRQTQSIHLSRACSVEGPV